MPKEGRIEFIARGLLRCGHWILVCRNVEGGYCYLPGGHVEFREPAAAALVREFDEEAGLRVLVGKPGMINEASFKAQGKWHHEVNVVFHVELSGSLQADDAAEEPPRVHSKEPEIAFEWLDLASLSDVDLRPLAIRAWIMSDAPSLDTCTWNSTIPGPDRS